MAERTAPSQRSSMPKIRKGKSAPRIRSKGYDQSRWQKELYHQRSSTPRIRKGKSAPRARNKGYEKTNSHYRQTLTKKAPSIRISMQPKHQRESPKHTYKYAAETPKRKPQAYVQVCGRNIKEKAPSVPRSTRLNVKREGPKCTMKYTAKRQRESPKRACEVRG